MSEKSRFWDGITTGDAAEAPYDAPTEFSQVLMSLAGGRGIKNNYSGVLVELDLQCLHPSVTGGQTVRIEEGRAIVYGTWYENSAPVDTLLVAPIVSTRVDRFILRKLWVAQTVRIVRVAGVEGGVEPSLVLTAGVQWEMPLCSASITTAGVVTITDERQYIILVPPEVIVFNNAAPTVLNAGTYTPFLASAQVVVFTAFSTLFDGNGKFYAPMAGVYEVSLDFALTATGASFNVRKNGVTTAGTIGPTAGKAYITLARSDYIEFIFANGSGGSIVLSNVYAHFRLMGNK